MEKQNMERGLKPRHIEMIALGGTIGVGLFRGSANTIQMAGPSVLLCYAVTGVVMFFIMRIMGEMLYQEPVTGSFATYGHKYISPFVGYLTACSYWFFWVVVGLSEITAVGIYVHYWFPALPQWISAFAGMAIVAAANMAAVKYYGEFEFWFALIKVVTILVMLFVGAAVIFFGFGNGGVPVGFSNLWSHGGFMPNGWGGLLAAMCRRLFPGRRAHRHYRRRSPGPAADPEEGRQQHRLAYPHLLHRLAPRRPLHLSLGRSQLYRQPLRHDLCQSRYHGGGRHHQLRRPHGGPLGLQQRYVQLGPHALHLS